jgi:hypothetical protein
MAGFWPRVCWVPIPDEEFAPVIEAMHVVEADVALDPANMGLLGANDMTPPFDKISGA